MKKTLCLAVSLSFVGVMSAFCGQRIDAAAWRTVQTYDLPALQKIESSLVGKIVGVRINYRGDRISHPKPNWYESSIWRYRPGDKDKFPFLRVMVAKKDLPSLNPSRPISNLRMKSSSTVRWGEIREQTFSLSDCWAAR